MYFVSMFNNFQKRDPLPNYSTFQVPISFGTMFQIGKLFVNRAHSTIWGVLTRIWHRRYPW